MPEPSPVADVVSHPVRLRIVQQLGGRALTTAQLREAMPDVTQATLYRHVAALVDGGFVVVVDERRVRGAVERTLALGERLAHVDHDELRTMSDAQLRAAFVAFLGDVGGQFDRALAAGADAERMRGLMGFGTTVLHVSADDLAVIQEGLAALLAPYREETDGTSRVHLTTVLMPDPGEG